MKRQNMAVLFSLELEKQLETQLTSGRASLTLQLIPPTNIVFGMRGRGSSIVMSILPQHIRKDFAMKHRSSGCLLDCIPQLFRSIFIYHT